MKQIRKMALAACLALTMSFGALTPQLALALGPLPIVNTSTDKCTSFGTRAALAYDVNAPNIEGGILSEIYSFIKSTIGTATQNLFQAFTDSDSYQYAVTAAMTLMVIFYAVGFTIGVVQPSFQQVLIRIAKMAVIGAVISPGGWTFFSQTVVTFFQDGSDELINGVQAIGFGIPAPAGATPFYALDRMASFLINPDTIIAIIGAIGAGGPFGLTMGGLLMIAMYGFFKLILKALEIYAVTFVARSLVLGVAPIFFVFLLFERTKNMFIAWVNALLNLSLQPILMFTFLSFFLVLIQTSSQTMLGAELCWTDFKNADSTVNPMAFWRFKDPVLQTVSKGEQTYKGSLECLIIPGVGDAQQCADFPLNVVDMLAFLLLVYLAGKFSEVTKTIASELSNAVVNLDNQGKLEQLIQSSNKSAGNAASGANLNPTAGGAGGGGGGAKSNVKTQSSANTQGRKNP